MVSFGVVILGGGAFRFWFSCSSTTESLFNVLAALSFLSFSAALLGKQLQSSGS